MLDLRDRVLIAGAGPTGLTLALCLDACGVPFDLIEAKDGPCRDSKALALNPLSLDQLELFGVGEGELGRGGRRVSRLNLSYEGMRLNPIDLRWIDHDRRYFIAQPQHATERDLIAALEARGRRVAFRTELSAIEPHGDHARATIRNSAGKEETFAYRYAIGCDGKRSRVREALGIEMSGAEYPMHLVLGDFELDWDADPGEAHYFVYDDTFFVFVPHTPGIWRVVVKHDGAPEASAPGPEAICEPVRRHFGRDPFKGAPVWFSKAPLYLKVASRLREGPVFLAGDAAHLFSPIGGTGMNTGMQDALNLGWKLAASMRGAARDDRLLASYEEERLPAIQANAASTNAVTRLIARLERAPERVAPFLPRLSNRRALKQMPAAQAGLTIKYGSAPAVGTVYRTLPGLLRASRVGPGPSWYLIAAPANELEHARIGAACEVLAPHVRPISAGPPGEAVLVRPDGIVSFAGKAANLEPMVRELTALLVPGERAQESRAC